MENHHPSTLLSMDSSASSSHDELDLEMSRQIVPPDINLPFSTERSPPPPPPQLWNSDPCDLLDVGLAPQVYDTESYLAVVPKVGRKCAKRLDSIWGAWFFFSFYFRPALNEKSKAKVVRDNNGVSGFDKSDLKLDVFMVQHDMENMYMWVFKDRPENALGKMQLRSYMNGHSRQGERPFPFCADMGFVRSHRMQRKHYRGLSNPQCVHGIEVVPSPNLSCIDEDERKRWTELTGRDVNFTIPPEASDFGSWRNLPNTDFELERHPPALKNSNSTKLLNGHSNGDSKKLLQGNGLNLSTQPSSHSNGGDAMDLSPSSKRRKDLFPHDEECYLSVNHPSSAEMNEQPWLNEFGGVMKNVCGGPVTAAKTIYEDEEGYLIIMTLPFVDLHTVKVSWRNTLSHGIIKVSCVSTSRMPLIKRLDRTFKLSDAASEHCPPGEFVREIPLSTRIPEDAKLEAYYDGPGTVLSLDYQSVDRNDDKSTGELPNMLAEGIHLCEADAEGGERWHRKDQRDGENKAEDFDENGRDDLLRHKVSRGLTRLGGRGRTNEGVLDTDQGLTSPSSGSRFVHGRNPRDKGLIRILDAKKGSEAKNSPGSLIADGFTWERKENDDCLSECRIGTKDISNLVKKAVGAAEAEARAANAPPEAIKAAGDAAAEVVKSAAFEEFKSTNNDEAAVLAASLVASTVVDAANAVEVARRTTSDTNDSVDLESTEKKTNEETEEYFIPDVESLAKLREKYCIQCLEILGEYVEVLGPVLHEKGVDVCLSLLERSSKHKGASKAMSLLPDVMKLICALAAHRKFAALFVDRGGMQKLLAVPRVEHTYFGLSSCLFTIGSLQGIMERVCALPSAVVEQVVGLAIQLLECSQDQARKNAALFFGAAFVFRAVIDAFDAQDGLQKSLSLLNEAASVRSGGNSGSLNLSGSAALRTDRSPSEVLTSSEKQIAYHTSVALRQYFRGHFLLLVESMRPNKNSRSLARNLPSARAAYKPLDLSNEAMDAIFMQLQKDRKLGSTFARARFPAVDKFLRFNGHITMLELCQAPPVERYLHDLLQYALGVLHIVTLVNDGRKMIVNATLSNNRVGIAVILDAANVIGNYVDPEIIQPALNVLINLVCPPPSISNRPQSSGAGNIQDRSSNIPSHGDQRERNGESSAADRGGRSIGCAMQASVNPTATSGLVGDRTISLGSGAGFSGLATQMEQGYRLAREAVRGNNGIKVLLHLLQPRIYSPPVALDCIRALACRVLLGLARDDTIAHILTKLQVGKKLSELIRDSGGQGRWQTELAQLAIELIGIVTNSGRASTLAATDAATPTLRRIERAAIAAATPITYHSRELLLLIHEHLQASGLATAADALLKDAQLTPLPSSLAPLEPIQETPFVQIEWPSGHAPSGFLSEKSKATVRNEDRNIRYDSSVSAKKKPLLFSPSFGSSKKSFSGSKQYQPPSDILGKEALSESVSKNNFEKEPLCKTPTLPAKRKLSDLKDIGLASSGKRLNTGEHGFRSPVFSTPANARKTGDGLTTPFSYTRDIHTRSTPFSAIDYIDESPCPSSAQPGVLTDVSSNSERLTLDSIVVQYLKHQHRQCPAPITTLPPLSLLQPHVCPEPKRCLDAPSNVTARIGSREFRSSYGGIHGNRKDRQFVYSRFRPWRTCRDDAGALLTCVTFLGNSSHVAVGSHNGELKIFDSNSSNLLESCTTHQAPLTHVQSHLAGETQLVLSSSSQDVCLWDASSISGGPMHTLEGRKAARFSNSGDIFATLTTDVSRREILLYDVQTCQVISTLSDTNPSSTGRGHVYPPIHFSPCDTMLLWNGVLWDRRQSAPVHRFDQFTDYGGGGFHPARNEVIINSEVWDLRRKFKLLRSVPSLDQTTITFNARGDVIYAILRRNLEDVMAAVHTRRVKHPLFAAFRTVDAINYSEIATVPVDRCVLDFASEPTDSFLGLITMDDQQEMYSSARVYEIGRRRPTDDDSDPDDADEEDEDEDDDDEDDDDVDSISGPDFGGDGESDADDLSDDDDSDDNEGDVDFMMDDVVFGGGGGGLLEIVTDGDDDDDDEDDSQVLESYSSGEEEDFMG